MHHRWRLIIDLPADGATNMARDEALAALAEGAAPTLRLYAWQPACLSLGRFQRSRDLDRAACASAGVEVVRRPSGGRALLHDAELTYAVIAGEHHPLLGGQSILASYRAISLALLAGLRRLGVAAELTPASSERTAAAGHSAACFDAPASYELTVRGRKLVGSAQTRRAGAILQHGAIPLAPHAARLPALLRGLPADLADRMIALDQAAGRAIGFGELAEAVVAGFAEAWGVAFEAGELSGRERAIERELRAEKYTSDAWTFGR